MSNLGPEFTGELKLYCKNLAELYLLVFSILFFLGFFFNFSFAMVYICFSLFVSLLFLVKFH